MEILSNKLVLLTLIFGVYFGAQKLQKRTGWILLNPILITIAVLIGFIKLTGISYESFEDAGHVIDFWLKPAIVALGVPLYLSLEKIKKEFVAIFASQVLGCVAGILSVVCIAHWLGASQEVVISMAPKSVTTPIAMEVSAASGGIPSLTAAIVVCVGLLGAVAGYSILNLCRVRNPFSQGLSIGTASHAIGTSRVMEKGQMYAAYASLGLILNGVLTALLTPLILRLMGM